MRSFYTVNEIFYSIQGEGMRTGTPYVFVRFAGCNLDCRADGPAGFDCDTDFSHGERMDPEEILHVVQAIGPQRTPRWVCFTGGEPSLQVNELLTGLFWRAGWNMAIETNGTHELPANLNWITVSPKGGTPPLKVRRANEMRFVMSDGDPLPAVEHMPITAEHFLLSPRFLADGSIDRAALEWCLQLLRENPTWRLSVQTHKFLGIR